MRREVVRPEGTRSARRAMRLSLFEGACFAGVIGFAEAYFIADAVRLGATSWQLGLLSALLLFLSPEPRFRRRRFSQALSQLVSRKKSNPLRLVAISALLMFAVYVGSPYFTPCMLQELRLDYRAFMAASAVQVAVKVLALPALGRAIDAHGATAAFRLAAILVSLIPLPWVFLDSFGMVIAIQALSGFAWALHEIALLALVLEHASARTRPVVFAAQSLLHGFAQCLGCVTAALLLSTMGNSLRTVFAISFFARLLVAAAVPFFVREIAGRPPMGRGKLLLRIVGFRPSGGVTHRPVTEEE